MYRKNLKICLPAYKMVYSVSFAVLLSLVRGIEMVSEIGIAMDANIALLAIIFCADSCEMEYRERRWEIFELYPQKNRVNTVRQRVWVQCIYLWLVSMAGYWLFYWQTPKNWTQTPQVQLYGLTLFAVACSIIFWGTLSVTIVGIVHNLWGGMGITLIFWLCINSKWGGELLGNASVFAFYRMDAPDNFEWMLGKCLAVIAAIGMNVAMPYIMRKGRVAGYGN